MVVVMMMMKVMMMKVTVSLLRPAEVGHGAGPGLRGSRADEDRGGVV